MVGIKIQFARIGRSLTAMADQTSDQLFQCQTDRYNGVTVDTSNITFPDTKFDEILAASLKEWMKTGVHGVWFNVPRSKASYIPILVNYGFEFHHAKSSYVMLTKWLPNDKPPLLPPFPHTYIGVGGIVLNSKNEILVIQEKFRTKRHWKLPGGYAIPGEEFADTAKREILEETGIETEFLGLVGFRHHHKHIFACSDIYVVCHMKPVGGNLRKCPYEIDKCQWMDIKAYSSHPETSDMNRFVIDCFLESQSQQATISYTPMLSFRKDCYNNVYSIHWKKSG